jgi:hypothetical protein
MRILSRNTSPARKTFRKDGLGRRVEITIDQEIDTVLVRAWATAGLAGLKPYGQRTDCAAPPLLAERKLQMTPAGTNSAKR